MRVIGAIRIRVGVIGVRVRAIGVRVRAIGSKGTSNRSKGASNQNKDASNRSKDLSNRSKSTSNRSKGTSNQNKCSSALLACACLPCEWFPSTAPLMRPRPHVPWSARRTSAPHLRRSAVPALPTSAPGFCAHLRRDFAHICTGQSSVLSRRSSASERRAVLVRGTSSHPQETQKQINPQTHALTADTPLHRIAFEA